MAKRSNTEARFQEELRQSFKSIFPSDFWYKIPDTPRMPNSSLRFITKKPFDIVGSISELFFAIETKVHKSDRAFPISAVHEHQVEGLKKAKGMLWINVRHGLGKKRENYVVCLDIDDFISETKEQNRKGRKSIPLKNLVGYARIDWIDKKWDLEWFFGNYCLMCR